MTDKPLDTVPITLKREVRKTEDVHFVVPNRYINDSTLVGKIVDVLLDAEPTNVHGDSWRDRVMLTNDVDEMQRTLDVMRKAYDQATQILSVVEEHGHRPLVKYGLREDDTCFIHR